PPGLLLIEVGSPKLSGKKDPAVAWSVWIPAGGLLVALQPPQAMAGEYLDAAAFDLTGDGVDEVLIRRRVGEGEATRLITTVHRVVPGGVPRLLLSYPTGPQVREFWAPLPSPGGPAELIIASYGGHAGGATAAPDAYLRFAYQELPEGPALVRGADLVLPPIPMLQFQAAELDGQPGPELVSLREFPQNTYRQQLWAQRLYGPTYFDNQPIGQGNDLTLVPSHPHVQALLFLYRDTKTTPPQLHLAAITLDPTNKPRTQFDVALPIDADPPALAWGHFLSSDPTDPGLALLLRPRGTSQPPWIALVAVHESSAAVELHRPAGSEAWTMLGAVDMEGDGIQELVGMGGEAIGSYSFRTRELTSLSRDEAFPLPVEVTPTVEEGPSVQDVAPVEDEVPEDPAVFGPPTPELP
ncbi:MAG TPA: hypothetical protein VEI97_16815, partial [bacterium]|nr:hypothetical protein [bacterium]